MKKILLMLTAFTFVSIHAQTQETTSFSQNEFKVNALGLVLGSFEFSYERLLNEESGIGISTAFSLIDEWDIRFALTPYYRYYFGKKPAQGFFAEGFGMLNNVRDYVYNNTDFFYNYERKNITDFAFGIGLGGKWISKKGILFEVNGGVGRNLFNNEQDRDFRFIGRIGLTAGYRF